MEAVPPGGIDIVSYDGTCGLCHRLVVFLLRKDPDGSRFRFASLQGDSARSMLSAEERGSLPDSIVVRTGEGAVLARSTAVLHVLNRLGGGWRTLAAVARIVPRPLADAGYDAIARVRKRFFETPPAACPVVPANLRARFLP